MVGLRDSYAIGDRVELSCHSDFSRPRPSLSWFVNGLRVSLHWRNSSPATRWALVVAAQLTNRTAPKQIVGRSLSRRPQPEVDLSEPSEFSSAAESDADANDANDASGDAPKSESDEAKLQNHFEVRPTSKSRVEANASLTRSSLALSFELSAELLRLAQRAAASQLQQPVSLDAPNRSHAHTRAAAVRRRKWPPPAQPQPQTDATQMRLSLRCKYKLTEVTDIAYNELSVRLRTQPVDAAQQNESPSSAGAESAEFGSEFESLSSSASASEFGSESESELDSDSDSESTRAIKLDDNRVRQSTLERALLVRALTGRSSRPTSGAGGRCDRFVQLQSDDPLLVRPNGAANASEQALPLVAAPGDRLRLNCSTARALLADSSATPPELGRPCDDAQVVRRRALSSVATAPAAADSDAAVDAPLRQVVRAGGNKQPAAVAYLVLDSDAQRRLAMQSARPNEPQPAPPTTTTATSTGASSRRHSREQQQPPPLLEWFINNQEVSCMRAL